VNTLTSPGKSDTLAELLHNLITDISRIGFKDQSLFAHNGYLKRVICKYLEVP